MRRLKFVFALGFTALVFAGPVHADAGSDFAALMRVYREAGFLLRPTEAIERGDERFTDRYDENLTATYMSARRRLNETTETQLEKIDKAALRPQDRLSYDIFRWTLSDEADELKPGVAERFQLLPLNQFNGAHITFPREMQWRTDYPLTRAQDYDNNIRRMIGFARWIDQAIVNMREGIKQGVVQPRSLVRRMIAQAEQFTTGDLEASVFMGPVKAMPAAIAGRDRARINDAYHEAVEGQMIPTYRRLVDFLKNEYLPQARDAIGLSAMPGGKEMYLHLVRSETTTDLSPDAIHALGLSELARIEAAMETVKAETGFAGTLDEFRAFLRTDPRFKFKDEAALLAEFNRVRGTVDAKLTTMFLNVPQAPLEFRLYESFVARDRPAAEYAPPGRGRPGIVSLNASDLPSRQTFTSEALEMHEGVPGHHLQITYARENRFLPQFRRFGSETAFAEGWALYAESLGGELGLYSDPYQKFGALSFDAWRACRLIVDTGIHWFGWTRGESIRFMLSHSALSEIEAAEEVDRYTAIPGQALAYKIGERKILDLRERAKAALGDKFDIRRFHDAILRDGSMPLAVLDEKMMRWIEAQKES